VTPLHHTFSLAVDGGGNLFLAGNHHPQVFRVDLEGIVHIVAGTALPGVGDEGVPAREGFLDSPCGVAVAPPGFPIWVSDTNNNRIRRIDADGRITTICGSVQPGYSGDGGPALEARLRHPYRLRLDPATGDLYVCDTENHVIRRIDSTGTITTVAGTGAPGFSGDGGPAVQARLQLPYDAVPGPDGGLYIADTGNNRIRRVAPDGTISTVAGTGLPGYSGDGQPAVAAQFDGPSAVAFDSRQNLWVADTFNHRVRMIAR
jgi:DNA-binding beta-propeller fold protein YncE